MRQSQKIMRTRKGIEARPLKADQTLTHVDSSGNLDAEGKYVLVQLMPPVPQRIQIMHKDNLRIIDDKQREQPL